MKRREGISMMDRFTETARRFARCVCADCLRQRPKREAIMKEMREGVKQYVGFLSVEDAEMTPRYYISRVTTRRSQHED